MPTNPAKVKTFLNSKKFDKIKGKLNRMDLYSFTAVGFFGKDVYPESGINLAGVAAIHEFGSKDGKIPKRSFMRSWLDKKKKEINKFKLKEYNKIIDCTSDIKMALMRLGEFAQGGIKETIIDLKSPPLNIKTIQKKKSSSPLIDTGRMLNSVRHQEYIGLRMIKKGGF